MENKYNRQSQRDIFHTRVHVINAKNALTGVVTSNEEARNLIAEAMAEMNLAHGILNSTIEREDERERG